MDDLRAVSKFVVYKHPSDYPGDFVVRRHVAGRGTVKIDPEPWAVVGSLAAARGLVPEGLVRLARDPTDDPVIVESWI
jgi:hypothetical protein